MRYCWLKSSTLFKCSPQPMLLPLFCYCCSAASKQKMAKTPGKTRKYLEFSGYFGYYPHWTLEIVVGHCQAFLTVVQSA